MNIPETLINAIKQPEIKGLVIDNSEIVIDSLLDDGTLKDIPILGNIFKVYSIAQNISNNVFSRKLLRFMMELGTVPDIERVEFVKKLDDNLEFKKEVGEKLLFILDKLDDVKKAIYLAKAFKLYLDQSISYKDYLVLAYIIDKFNIAYLPELSVSFKYQIDNMPAEIYDHFLYCGILQSKGNGESSERIIGSNPILYKSKMGKVFATLIIELSDIELRSNFIKTILDIEITKPIGDYESDVKKFISRKDAENFLKNIDNSHFETSLISGHQFMDQDRKTRFRRTGTECYEFFNVSQRS